MRNIRFSLDPSTGLINVEDIERGGVVALAKEDITDLIKAVQTTKVKTNMKNQFSAQLGGILIKDKVQNAEVLLTVDDIIRLGNFVRKNDVASRKDFDPVNKRYS